MKRKIIFLLSFLVCMIGLTSNGQDHDVVLRYENQNYVNLPINSKPACIIPSDFCTIDSLISLAINKYNTKQTAAFKTIIKKFPDLGLKISDFIIDLPKYYRQLIVVSNRYGEKEVWVNCFSNDANLKYWLKTVVFVNDGGNNFFNLRINLSRRIYYELRINGV